MLPVVYTPGAEKYFRKIRDKQLKKMYKDAIMKIRRNPDLGDAKTGDLKGIRCLDIHYDRANYELAYRVSRLQSGDMIVVIMAGTRENFYQVLKRYIK